MVINKVDLGLGGGSLLQIANRTLTQSMSYIIDTPNGGVIVIDGGNDCAEDSNNLYGELAKRGKKVDLWIITHAHSDHLGAPTYLMEKDSFDIKVEKFCYNFPDTEWLMTQEDSKINSRFLECVKNRQIEILTPHMGQIIDFDSISIEFISVPSDYKEHKNINASSIIFLVHFPKRDVLFMGDFDVTAEEEFLQHCDAAKLRCDIVQMPHHGQNGIDRAFYELIMPKICLYTTPKWLWENNRYKCNDPETVGKGPFTTLETRKWMEELGAEQSYAHKDGDYLFY